MDNASVSSVSRLSNGETIFKIEVIRRKGPEVRRLRGNFTFEQFVQGVRRMWSRSPTRVRVEYTDEDGDRVRIGGEAEWQEALTSAVQRGLPCLRLYAVRPGVAVTGESSSEDDGPETGRLPPQTLHADPSIAADRSALAADSQTAAPEKLSPQPPSTGNVKDDIPDVVEVEAPTRRSATPEAVPPPIVLPECAVLDLLSRLFDCDAKEEMERTTTAVDFGPVATRTGAAEWDVDMACLNHVTVQRTNMWIEMGWLEKAETTLEAALRVWQGNQVLQYNVACSAALRGDLDKSYTMLREAIQNGFSNVSQLRSDPDLAALREHPEYMTLIRMANTRTSPAPQAGSAGKKHPTPASRSQSRPAAADASSSSSVTQLLALFPHLTIEHASALLQANNNDVGKAANAVLNL